VDHCEPLPVDQPRAQPVRQHAQDPRAAAFEAGLQRRADEPQDRADAANGRAAAAAAAAGVSARRRRCRRR
jgi:hypothetical protein